MNIHRSRWMMFVTLTLLLLASALLQAQSFEATVVGTVKDAHGAAIVANSESDLAKVPALPSKIV